MNWKEKFDNEFDAIDTHWLDNVKNFISTEIIEKLIDEIPDNMMNGYEAPGPAFGKNVKQQLKEEWL